MFRRELASHFERELSHFRTWEVPAERGSAELVGGERLDLRNVR
jgi:hypothetical protein